MKSMKIYNTFTRKKEEFVPVASGFVGMYVCGPTVYGMPHLGHAKSYINFDIIRRYFMYLGNKVKYVQNITDVGHLVGDGDEGEDKIARQAVAEKLDPYEIAYKYELAYFDNMDKLNVLRPSISCRATGFIPEIIAMVQDIINKGYAYATKEGNVYFNVRKYSKYGQLSNRKLDNNLSGERIEVAGDKKNPEDFALWKAVDKTALMQWDSPWGKGCPGWHIECSVMNKKFLGEKFDIHGGGIDNMFPHHECECAQSEIAVGHIPMNYFMHNGLVTVNGTKMGKSLGNFITLPDLFKNFDPMVVRYFILQFHYRSSVDFSDAGLQLAEKQFKKLQEAVFQVREKTTSVADKLTSAEFVELKSKFEAAMNEDFNTPVAMVEVNKLVKLATAAAQNEQMAKEYNLLVKLLAEDVLGLNFGNLQAAPKVETTPAEVEALAKQRWQAKQNRDFKLADSLREKIAGLGYAVKDSKEGYTIEKL